MECNFRQNHFYKIDHTETATPSYTLLGASLATDIKHKGKKAFSVYLIGENLLNRAYQNHLSRLKYAGLNPVTGKEGFYKYYSKGRHSFDLLMQFRSTKKE